MIEYSVVTWEDPLFAQAVALRTAVLYEPFGIPADPPETDRAPGDVHAVGLERGRVVAYGRLVPTEEGWRMRQVAVEPARQAEGIGSAMVAFLTAEGSRRGESRFWLAAREHAIGFYERIGFVVTNADFPTGTGIRHARMELRPPSPARTAGIVEAGRPAAHTD